MLRRGRVGSPAPLPQPPPSHGASPTGHAIGGTRAARTAPAPTRAHLEDLLSGKAAPCLRENIRRARSGWR